MNSFAFLVSASLSSCFRFLLFLYGRLFVKFLLTKVADDTVAGAFSLETTKCAFNAFVFANFYRRHYLFTILCRCLNYLLRNYSNLKKSCQVFFYHFLGFLRIFCFYSFALAQSLKNLVEIIKPLQNPPPDAYKWGKYNRRGVRPLRIRIRRFCKPISALSKRFFAVAV